MENIYRDNIMVFQWPLLSISLILLVFDKKDLLLLHTYFVLDTYFHKL